jgi:hypothetical protein
MVALGVIFSLMVLGNIVGTIIYAIHVVDEFGDAKRYYEMLKRRDHQSARHWALLLTFAWGYLLYNGIVLMVYGVMTSEKQKKEKK